MPIRVLPPEIASKIAAGEVVARPASVVKELVENSLDAGATQVGVEVQGGGVRLIRVVDNGVGIPPEEVEIAFGRYATSKIATATDLETISSLGFRGEALPSIAAVAEVTLSTRSGEELAGTFVNIKNGAIVEKARRGCPQGTTVTVRNLFRNVPARLKFLKSPNTENGHISHLVTQYSFSFPEVRFSLTVDGRTTFRSPGGGRLKDVLIEVYGLETARSLLEIEGKAAEANTLLPRVTGFISPPSLSRSSRSYLSFFVNRRWVQSRMLSYAIEEAYHGLLMVGKHPIAVINIGLPPEEVDVNVHPTKSEVKFRYEREVFAAVQQAVRAALVEQAPVPSLKARPQAIEASPLPLQESLASLNIKPVSPPPVAASTRPQLPILRVLGQMTNTYIIAEGPDGVYLVDQHAAHERVLFEQIREQQKRRAVAVQGLLEPVAVELTAQQAELLKSQVEALSENGFALEPFGAHAYLVRAVPAVLEGQKIAEVLIDMLDSLGEGTTSDSGERIATSLACHGAVRAGQVLSQEEMRGLIRQLEQASLAGTCPHGRPTMIHLSTTQLEREFGRR